MSRWSGGVAGVWAEVQRQQQRQAAEQVRQQRERERQQRAQERELARGRREQQAAYRQQREAEALRRTEEIEARVAELSGLLAAGCRGPAFRAASLARPEDIAEFAPGPLAQPVPMPHPGQYQARGGRGFGGARAQAEARSRFERDWAAARAAEDRRLAQLAAYRRQYDEWVAARLAEIRRHNAGIAEMTAALRAGDPDAAVEYFSAALYASAGWPGDLPRQVSAAYDPGARELVLDWQLPRFDVVPEVKSVRYMPTADRDKETARPAAQRRALYRDVMAQCLLLVLHEVFAADEFGALESVALNGFVDDHDPATGRRTRIVLGTVLATREVFAGLHLAQVSAVDCFLDGLHGRLSARPDQRVAVRPGRVPEQVGRGVVSHGEAEEPDLYVMDPLDFESLVAQLFREMGMQAVTTARSNDGGVDVDALDPTPIRGGKIVVQVKRYRNTVPPTAVRDLYGTVQDVGANKGVLVTTSKFGPGSHTFANGKPLELVSGPELVDLLHRHGLRGRLGDGRQAPARTAGAGASTSTSTAAGTGTGTGTGAGVDGGGPAGSPDGSGGADASAAPYDYSTLGMSWSGSVALDVCALVCAGGRVLDDDHFVFYNNPRTPDGTVRALPARLPDRAALQVAFDRLPSGADRLVLAAAVDPTVNPDADLSGFLDARIRLTDAAGDELGSLEVSDGRPGETALVLGSFRRRANGDWDFVIGGKGYRDGLEALVKDHGIEVA